MSRENIRIVVLITGEQVIGEQIESNSEQHGILLENPVFLMLDPNPANRGRVLMMPYLQFSNDKEVFFPEHSYRHIIGNVKLDFVNAYSQQFGDGLIVAAPGSNELNFQ